MIRRWRCPPTRVSAWVYVRGDLPEAPSRTPAVRVAMGVHTMRDTMAPHPHIQCHNIVGPVFGAGHQYVVTMAMVVVQLHFVSATVLVCVCYIVSVFVSTTCATVNVPTPMCRDNGSMRCQHPFSATVWEGGVTCLPVEGTAVRGCAVSAIVLFADAPCSETRNLYTNVDMSVRR